MFRPLFILLILASIALARPLITGVTATRTTDVQRDVDLNQLEGRFISNAERIKRGLPLNKPQRKPVTRTLGGRGTIPSPTPKAAILAVYKDTARTNLVGYLSLTTSGTYPFPVTTDYNSANVFTLPNQGPSDGNTVGTGYTRPYLASAYGQTTATGTQLVSTGTNYITFYASASMDNGSPQTEAGQTIAAETSNWGIPSGTYGPITYSFVDSTGAISTPNFYYKSTVSYNLRAATNPTIASKNPRLTGYTYAATDQVYLSWVQPT